MAQMQEADETMTQALARACLDHDARARLHERVLQLRRPRGAVDHGGDPASTHRLSARATDAVVQQLLALHESEVGSKVSVIAPGFVYGPGGLFKSSFYDTLQKGQLRVFGQGRELLEPRSTWTTSRGPTR